MALQLAGIGSRKTRHSGNKVDRLVPKGLVNSIPLKQYGATYSLDFAQNRVRIEKMGSFHVRNSTRYPGAEMVSAVLVCKYYLYMTRYLLRELCEGLAALFGRQVHFSMIGGLKLRLRNSLEAPIPVEKMGPPLRSATPSGRGTNSIFRKGGSGATVAGPATGT